ncbi:MAG: gliding motility-associated C-terminal domain-containing protein, partial [Bacteroidota bacterium]
VTISSPAGPTFTFTKTDLACNGAGTGAVTISATGGTAPLEYSSNNGSTFQAGATFSSLSAGAYALLVKDAAGCTITGSATLTEPAAIVPTATASSTTCNGTADGGITVTATGGTGAYQFSSDNGATFQNGGTFSAIGAGAYLIVVKDASGCTANTTSTVTQPAVLSVTATKTDLLCNAVATGVINAIATGGNGGYTYSRDNGISFQASGDFTALAEGTYQVRTRDTKGCTSAAFAVTLTEPVALVLNATGTDITSCTPGNDGTITATGSGGTGTLQYTLDARPFQAAGNFSALGAGTYQVRVKDGNDCITTTPVTILTPGGLTFTFTAQDLTCFNDGSGAIAVTATGGTAPLQYSSDNGTTFQALSDFNALAAGNYTLLVKDAANCTFTSVATVDQPANILPTTTAIKISCNGLTDGSLSVTATGGDSNFQFSIDNGGTFQPSGNFTGLTAGTYAIVVRDGINCTTTSASSIIAEPAVIALTGVAVNATCANNDGTLTITGPTGGTTPFTLEFNNTPLATMPAGGLFAGLSAGSYPFKATDKNGCIKSETFVITKPADIQATALTRDPTCAGNGSDGIVTVTITSSGSFEAGISESAGTPPAAFLPVTSAGAGTIDFNNLGRNDYFVTVRSASFCPVTLTSTIASGPVAVDLSVTATGKICFEDQASLTLTGITGDPTLPYTCEIIDGSAAVVVTRTITPAEALANVIINTALTGAFNLRLTQDQTTTSGCPGITSALIPFSLDAPASVLDTISTVTVESQEVQGTGSLDGVISPSGEDPYETSLELTTPAVSGQTFFEDFSAASLPSGGTNPVFSYTGLFGGEYTLTLRDAFGCQKTYLITIDLNPELFVPNIFTPNGDQVNDTFYVRNLPANSGMVITNRWGKEIFSSVDYKNDWDAKGNGDGIYYYRLILNGKSITGWVEVLSGK